MVEQYPDTIQADSSNLSAITHDDLAQLAERYSHTVQVDSSSLSVVTNWLVAQLARASGFYPEGCEFESHRANQG